jgi:Kdo2-lipid IVA lauroyltransferase/acyltransferase
LCGHGVIQIEPNRFSVRLALRMKAAIDAGAGHLAVFLLNLVRRLDPDRSADFAGRLMRRIGPLLPEHRTGRANLAAAYPEKSPAEIETILRGVWDNLGRTGVEFAHLDRLWDYDLTRQRMGRIEDSDEDLDRIQRLRDSGRPALVFAAHLANWELSALAATALGLDVAVLYRAPNLGDVAKAVNRIRSRGMGTLIPTGPDAVIKIAAALERGAPVALLVDQHFTQGIEVEFFGRRCKVNPMIARLARNFECPIHGTRVIRLPGHRFRVTFSEPITPPRASDGRIDIAGTMQAITNVIEGWIREHPEQWLWLHRRWR